MSPQCDSYVATSTCPTMQVLICTNQQSMTLSSIGSAWTTTDEGGCIQVVRVWN